MNIWKTIKVAIKSTQTKILFIFVILFSIIFSIISLLFPLIAKNVITDFENGNIKIWNIIVVVIFLLLKSSLEALYEYNVAKLGSGIIKELRSYVYNQIIRYNKLFFDKYRSGELSSRILNDTEVVQALLSSHIPQLSSGIILIVGSFVITAMLDWKLTIAIIIVIPSIFLLISPLLKKMDSLGFIQQNEKATFISTTQETFKNIGLVKAFTAEQLENQKIKKSINNLYKIDLKENKLISVIGPTINFLLILGVMIIIGYGSYRVTIGNLSLSTLIAFVMYVFQLINPMANVSNFIGEFRKANGAFESLSSLISSNHLENSGHLQYKFEHTLEFKNVSLILSRNKILKNLNFTVLKGDNLTIIGKSGSGKTTILNMIEKFYSPTYGSIEIDNVNIEKIDTESLRKNVGLVSQDSPIITGTIKENLLYGLDSKSITNKQIKESINKANLKSFIENKELGLDTYVGESGNLLSGGERQRINIARLFLKNPDIILLDEPTSSLDLEATKLVNQSIKKLTNEKTVIQITHNIKDIDPKDNVIFIDNGEYKTTDNIADLFKTNKS